MSSLLGVNLRGKTVRFTFNSVDNVQSAEPVKQLLYIDDQNYVNISLIHENYYYYDPVEFLGTSIGVDHYELSDQTITFPNDKDYIVSIHDETYITAIIDDAWIYGMWRLNDTLNLSGVNLTQSVTALTEDDDNHTIYEIRITSSKVTYNYNLNGLYDVYSNGSYTTIDNNYRYVNFKSGQYVSTVFVNWLESNAVYVNDGFIDAGTYTFKMDIANDIDSFMLYEDGGYRDTQYIYFDFRPTNRYTDGSQANSQWALCLSKERLEYLPQGVGYHSSNLPTKFKCFGWNNLNDSTGTDGFKWRTINIHDKTYLDYRSYRFLKSVLIPLNHKEYLDITGIWALSEDMKKMSELTASYMMHMTYSPVADVLYKNTSGTQNLSDLDLSKYLYVTIKAAPSTDTNFKDPQCTAFAVQNIVDCGGTMKLQIADNHAYTVWNVTNNAITSANDTTKSTYRIYEVIGYRWEGVLTTTQEEEPVYSYKYVKGKLTCPSGKYFNNYHHYDKGTEFRIELNFRLTSLGVELASNTANANNNWSLSVNSDGYVVYKQMYNGKTGSGTWTKLGKLEVGRWYSLSLYINNVTSTNEARAAVNISVVDYAESPNFNNYETIRMYYLSQFSTTRNMYIGEDNVDLRNTILIKGSQYESGDTDTQNILSVDIDDATVGASLFLTSGAFELSGGLVYGT